MLPLNGVVDVVPSIARPGDPRRSSRHRGYPLPDDGARPGRPALHGEAILTRRTGPGRPVVAAGKQLAWRCAGVVALAAAWLSSLAHRTVLDASRAGPATALETLLGLATFILASLGVLLLIHGRRLFHDAARPRARQACQRGRR